MPILAARHGQDLFPITKAATTIVRLYGVDGPAAESRAARAMVRADEWSYKVADKPPTDCYDIHATLLRPPGIDHTRLTYRNNGIDRRLTDVHGQVVQEILA